MHYFEFWKFVPSANIEGGDTWGLSHSQPPGGVHIPWHTSSASSHLCLQPGLKGLDSKPTWCSSGWPLLLAGRLTAALHGVNDPRSRPPRFCRRSISLIIQLNFNSNLTNSSIYSQYCMFKSVLQYLPACRRTDRQVEETASLASPSDKLNNKPLRRKLRRTEQEVEKRY